MKKPLSLRRFLLMQMGVVVVLPAVLIAVLVWQVVMPQMRATAAVQHEALARAIAGQISAHLAGGQRQLTALAEHVANQPPSSAAQLVLLLDAQCGGGELFETIYLTAGKTNVIGAIGLSRTRRAGREDLLGMDLSGRGLLSPARRQARPVWSQTFLSTASSRMAVALTVPLADGGALIGEITLDQLSELIRHLPAEDGQFTMVLDGQGRIVADSQMTRAGQQLNLAALSGPKAAGASGTLNVDGQRLLATAVEVAPLGWKVLVAQPAHSAFKLQRTVLLMIGLGLGAALALALALAWLQANHLSRIFRTFGDLAGAVARGEYGGTWPTAKTAEFHLLTQSLQHMAERIGQRESALVDSETRMRITLDSIGDAVIATDAGGVITRINPMAEKLTGWSTAEAIGQPLANVFCIVDALTGETAADPVAKVLASGAIVGLANHTMLIARDGRHYQIADSGAPIRQTNGDIVGVVLVFRDVTEAYGRDQKIREAKRMLDDITANVPGMVFQLRATANHVYTSEFIGEKAWELFGIDPNPDGFFKRFSSHMPEKDRARFVESVRQAVDHAGPWRYEGRFVKPDGNVLWFSGQANPRQEGRTIIYYGVLIDISGRKQMEQSLHLAQFTLDKASIGIFRVDEAGRLLKVNEQACRILGYGEGELQGLTVFDIAPEFTPAMWSQHLDTLRRVRTRTIETQARHKNGTNFSVQVLINLMLFQDQEYQVAFVEDISERKRAEQEAKRLEEASQQAQKMEAIGTLAGGIAHDFNNILSGVIGYAELALAPATPAERVRQHLGQIYTAGLRARDLVQQILTFSRRDERQLRLLQIAPLVKETLGLLRSSLPTTIDIRHDIAEKLLPVLADPTQIHQIVMNLCTNATQAMEDNGGQLEVSLDQVRLTDADIMAHQHLRPGDYLRLCVRDTGPGITPELLQRIFDPYFTTKAHGKGTGLGLAVVHGIVQRHGGSIAAASQPDRGTTFTVYLPAVAGHADAAPRTKPELPGGREHILLVDDESILIDVGRQLLETLGYRVSTAEGSEAALALFCEAPRAVDLVISDVTMPNMTGDRLAAQLLQIRPNLPIILCTGYNARLSREKAMQIGIRALVHKPLILPELAATVRKVLDGGQALLAESAGATVVMADDGPARPGSGSDLLR